MRIAVAVFVKTPGVSPLKTRLAASIGKDAAETFHRLASACTMATVALAAEQLSADDISLHPYWAVAELKGLNHSDWSTMPRLHAGEGGLGERMWRVGTHLKQSHDAVGLLGADAPHISIDSIVYAAKGLRRDTHLFGPCQDGGFYLYFFRQPPPLRHWQRVVYSREDTLSAFKQGLPEQATAMPTLADVDEVAQLSVLKDQLDRSLSQSHQDLWDWLIEYAPI